MTNVLAVHAVGEALRAYLESSYPAALRERFPCEFRLLATGELATAAGLDDAITLLLYRVTVNEEVRSAPRLHEPGRDGVPLSLELHFLLTAWARSAAAEHTLLAWAARQLHQRPTLDRSLLGGAAAWGGDDVVQLVPAELGLEDMMRVWNGLGLSYQLSMAYEARVIRIDGDVVTADAPSVRPPRVPRLPGG